MTNKKKQNKKDIPFIIFAILFVFVSGIIAWFIASNLANVGDWFSASQDNETTTSNNIEDSDIYDVSVCNDHTPLQLCVSIVYGTFSVDDTVLVEINITNNGNEPFVSDVFEDCKQPAARLNSQLLQEQNEACRFSEGQVVTIAPGETLSVDSMLRSYFFSEGVNSVELVWGDMYSEEFELTLLPYTDEQKTAMDECYMQEKYHEDSWRYCHDIYLTLKPGASSSCRQSEQLINNATNLTFRDDSCQDGSSYIYLKLPGYKALQYLEAIQSIPEVEYVH